MLGLFVLAVGLWVTRADIDLGGFVIPGWAGLLAPAGEDARFIHDGSVAVFVGVLAFVIPAGEPGSRRRLLVWEDTRRLPYDILFLLGAGIAIAGAFESTGLTAAFGELLGPAISGLPAIWAVLLTALVITFLTEVSSNTAITSLFLPLLMAGCASAGVDPRLFMMPATIAASCAFMFPIATPPNAVVFSSGRVGFAEMARAGFLLNLLSVGLLTLAFWWYVRPVLGIEVGVTPDWLR